MSDKYKATRRCYLIDHHSPQPPIVPLGNMDIHEYEAFFEEAKIDSLMVYCKDHWGVTYYDSDVEGAQKHAGVKGDWIREVRDLTRQKDIEFVAYYCIEYDEGAARRFPEWRVRKADGSPLIRDDLYAKWSLMCYETDYREYALSQLEEIVSRYQPDALFLDIFGKSLCYCDTCRNKFRKIYGYALPEKDEEIRTRRTDIDKWLDDSAEAFYRELDTRLKKIDPTLGITINFASHYPKRIRDLLDYQYSEPLLSDNWFSSAYARDTASGQFPMLAPGEASQVYNYDKPAQYICDLSMIAAQGCRVGMYSGSQHIDGTLEHQEARCLGAVYSELEKLTPWLSPDRDAVKCAGIIQSDLSKGISHDKFEPDAILRMKHHAPHTDAVLGAMMACEQAKIPCRILPEMTVSEESLSDYSLIILPEVYVVTDTLRDALSGYVKKGGKVLVSAGSGLYDPDLSLRSESSLSDQTGLHFDRINTDYSQNDWSAYLRSCNTDTFPGLMQVSTPPVSEFFVENTVSEDASPEILASFALPAVACSPTEWINWWSPPPESGSGSGIPAIVRNSFGKGSVLYLAYDYFTMYMRGTYRDSADQFAGFLKLMDIRSEMRLITETPSALRTAFFETADTWQIHEISLLPHFLHGETVPLEGGILESRKEIRSAKLVYPEEKELSVLHGDGLWHVKLPAFGLQQLIVLEK